jgi:hypothetical protein
MEGQKDRVRHSLDRLPRPPCMSSVGSAVRFHSPKRRSVPGNELQHGIVELLIGSAETLIRKGGGPP